MTRIAEFTNVKDLPNSINYWSKLRMTHDDMETVLELCDNYGDIRLSDDRMDDYDDHDGLFDVFRIGGEEFVLEEIEYAFVYDNDGYEIEVIRDGEIYFFDFWVNEDYDFVAHDDNVSEYWLCPDCDEVFYEEEEFPEECPHCGYSPKSIKNVLSYYHEAKGTFCKENPEKAETLLHMGFELETDTSGLYADMDGVLDAIEELNEIPDIADLEEDGSLGKLGFEIISHPLTVPTMKRLAAKICAIAERNSVGLTGNCGLHFHLDLAYLKNGENGGYYLAKHSKTEPKYRRISLSDYVKAKVHTLVTALYNDGTINMEVIDRRNGYYSYCRPQNKEKVDYEPVAPKVARLVGKTWGGRYDAVNVGNPETAELRFFAATLDLEELLADIDIAAAIAEYSRIHEIFDLEDATTDEFFGYIRKNAESYPDAVQYLKSLDFMIA